MSVIYAVWYSTGIRVMYFIHFSKLSKSVAAAIKPVAAYMMLGEVGTGMRVGSAKIVSICGKSRANFTYAENSPAAPSPTNDA